MGRENGLEPGDFRFIRTSDGLFKMTLISADRTGAGVRIVADVEQVPEPDGRAVDLSDVRASDPDTLDDDFEEA